MATKEELVRALTEWKERRRNEPPQPFGSGPLTDAMVTTTRHDSHTLDDELPVDQRVRDVAMFAMGSLSVSDQNVVRERVKRFHDHKGILYVLHDGEPLSENVQDAISKAWVSVAGEMAVRFVLSTDRKWIDIWDQRRF